jgi:hypothetical protein
MRCGSWSGAKAKQSGCKRSASFSKPAKRLWESTDLAQQIAQIQQQLKQEGTEANGNAPTP